MTPTEKHRRFTYGITAEEFTSLVEAQDNLCAICRVVPPTDLDHDHDTGRIRGVLCHHCNFLLGHAKENLETLDRAIRYLREGAR